MTEQLREAELSEFLTFAALISTVTPAVPVEVEPLPVEGTTPPAPRAIDHLAPAAAAAVVSGLVIQGDVAFLRRHARIDALVKRVPLSGPVSVVGGPSGHVHWLIPNGPGIEWMPDTLGGPCVLIPDGVTARVHHDAVPVEHDDLTLAGGLWQIRVQTVPVPGTARRERAERYLLPQTWRLPRFLTGSGDGARVFNGVRYWDASC